MSSNLNLISLSYAKNHPQSCSLFSTLLSCQNRPQACSSSTQVYPRLDNFIPRLKLRYRQNLLWHWNQVWKNQHHWWLRPTNLWIRRRNSLMLLHDYQSECLHHCSINKKMLLRLHWLWHYPQRDLWGVYFCWITNFGWNQLRKMDLWFWFVWRLF